MKHNFLKRVFVFSFLFSLLFGAGHAQGLDQPATYEANKAKLLSYMIRERLETNHFNHIIIDDTVSEAAFGLYLKQLDFQKTVLLQEDVEKLRKYSKLIDDEMNSGKLELAVTGSATLSARSAVVYVMVKEILSGDFDFSKKEFIETDAEKLDYCKTDAELKERWEKLLTYQVLRQYLNQPEENAPIAGAAPTPTEKPTVGRPTVGRTEPTGPPEDKKQQTDEDLRKAARNKVLKTYDHFFSRIAQEKEPESYERFFAAVTHAFDPHTDYMPPINKEDFDIRMSGSLEGIGATLKEDENHIKVVSIIAGSPASRQGQLQAEDIILKVGEGAGEPLDIIGMRVKDAVRLIRGKKGTEVRLTINKPDGKILTIPIVRDIIRIEETFVKGATIKNEKTGDNFGYIKVPSFYRDFEKTGNSSGGRNSTDDVKAELTNLQSQNIKGMIIDLRNNGGGALTDAVKIAGLFIRTGPVVQVKSSNGKTTLSDAEPDITYTGPVVILVNRLSASASEILAGALQDYSRAVIMGGEHTHGKGTVQTVMDLNENVPFQNMQEYKPLGALKLTIQKFYRISGDSTQYRGVVPDVVLPDVMSGLKTGEQYLDFAMPWDTVNPVAFTKWPKCGPDISVLREKSQKRVVSNQGFIDMKTEAIRLEDTKKNTLKSLNIDDVRSEIEESRKQKEQDPETSHGSSKTKGDAKTPEEKKEAFLKEISADAYVKEAISVIEDIITADPSCISITAN